MRVIDNYMGKFKEFLINEEIGLGELGTKIDDMMNSKQFGNQIGGALTSAQADNGMSFKFPSTDMTIPSVEKTGRITTLLLKKNPIYVRMSDGTEANFSYEEYRRIQGDPALGKTMTIFFQRHPEDRMSGHSKIDKAIVRD